MKANTKTGNSEPLLSAVARKVGHAAGTLTKVTQTIAGSISRLPQDAKGKMSEALEPQGKRAPKRRIQGVRPGKKSQPKPRQRIAALPAAKRQVKGKAGAAKKR